VWAVVAGPNSPARGAVFDVVDAGKGQESGGGNELSIELALLITKAPTWPDFYAMRWLQL
jgi:hypothetical protein